MKDNENSDRYRVRDNLMDAPDWEYVLAGHLVGTDWVHPESGVDTIGKAQPTYERHEGQRIEHPEVVFKYAGIRFGVNTFLRRIDPNDFGDIEPADDVAERIVSIQEERSWRKLHTERDQ